MLRDVSISSNHFINYLDTTLLPQTGDERYQICLELTAELIVLILGFLSNLLASGDAGFPNIRYGGLPQYGF